jgi:hypothetical protein
VKADGILTAPRETSVLYPEDGGNMHCFTAQNSCAVLDVLGPPYDDGRGRHCQYYNVSSSAISVGKICYPSQHGCYIWFYSAGISLLSRTSNLVRPSMIIFRFNIQYVSLSKVLICA